MQDLIEHHLISDFFTFLNDWRLDQCEHVLEQLRILSTRQPSFAPWCSYLAGILTNERDSDYAEAERIFSRLLEENQMDPTLQSRVLFALGRTYDYQGLWQKAIHYYESSLSTQTNPIPIEQAKTWKQIALTYYIGFARGDLGAEVLSQALDYCRRALGALEGIPEPPDEVVRLVGKVWNAFGLIYMSLSRWDEAIACYKKDLAICQAQRDLHGIGLTYGNLGEAYQKRGRDSWPTALNFYQQAVEILNQFEDRYESIEARANLGFLYQKMGKSNQAMACYEQAIDFIEGIRQGITSSDAREGFFATVVDTYAHMVLLYHDMGQDVQAFNIVERARSRAFLDMLASRSPQLSRSIQADVLTLADVQARLPEDVLLLEYFTTGLIEPQRELTVGLHVPQRHRFPAPRTLLFAVTRHESRVYDVDISPNDLHPGDLNNISERYFLGRDIRRMLYRLLLEPVADLLKNKHRLYLIPHGPLHYVPFQALISSDGNTLLHKDGPQIIYAPSATLLVQERSTMNPMRPDLSCLALGYNGRGTAELQFAEDEARRIAQLLNGRMLVGSAPKKDILYAQSLNCLCLHFACHGEFHPEQPLDSVLHLAPAEKLTAMEIFKTLHLASELVVLSSCESGLSRVRRGDELLGLIRAFLYAGADSVVATLWRVDDRSTQILMERFYREVLAGTGFAEALKRAQLYLKDLTLEEVLEIRERAIGNKDSGELFKNKMKSDGRLEGESHEKIYADPYYWAPFVLVGSHRGSIVTDKLSDMGIDL